VRIHEWLFASDCFGGKATRCHILSVFLLALVACTDGGGACPFAGGGEKAPSAGCFLVSAEGLLLVQGLNGRVSVPGGSSEPGETAQCTAFRETWEETGLRLQPRELLGVFSTGFHLYRCERDALSGEINPPPRFEVRAAFYLPADRFDNYVWRFEGQQELLKSLLLSATGNTSGEKVMGANL
jgi:8-oxo-dGTP diphosphatase